MNFFKKSLPLIVSFLFCHFSWGANYLAGDAPNAEWTATDYWKKEALIFIPTNEYPNANDANVYFSGNEEIKVKLTSDINVNDIIISYEKTGSITGISSGSNPITIDLNGFNLTCSNLTLNNGSLSSTLKIINSSSTPSQFTINAGSLSSSTNQNHSVQIGDNITFIVPNYDPNTNGSITIVSGENSTVTLPDSAKNDPSLVSANAIWTGAQNSDWGNINNWSGITDTTTLSSKDVLIPASCPNYPEISGDFEHNAKITVQSGASFTTQGNSTITEFIAEENSSISLGNDNSDISRFGDINTLSSVVLKNVNLSIAGTINAQAISLGGTNSITLLDNTTLPSINAVENISIETNDHSLTLNGNTNLAGYNFSTTSAGEVIISAGMTFNANDGSVNGTPKASSISIGGNLTNNGTLILGSGETVTTGSITNNTNITIGSGTLTTYSDFLNAGTLSIDSGTINISEDLTNQQRIIINTGKISISGNLENNSTFTPNSSEIHIAGNFTNNSSFESTSETLHIAKDFNDTSTISTTYNHVILGGTPTSLITSTNQFNNLQIIGDGTIKFNNSLTIDTLSCEHNDGITEGVTLNFPMGQTQNISNLTIIGSQTSYMTIKSSSTTAPDVATDADRCIINIPITNATLKYVNIENTESVNDSIDAISCINNGNNINFIFPSIATWTGIQNSDWGNINNWSGITDITDLNNSEIEIPSTYTNPPILTNNFIHNNKLTIKEGATFTTRSNVTFTEFIAEENSTISLGDDASDISSFGIDASLSSVSFKNVNLSIAGTINAQEITFDCPNESVTLLDSVTFTCPLILENSLSFINDPALVTNSTLTFNEPISGINSNENFTINTNHRTKISFSKEITNLNDVTIVGNLDNTSSFDIKGTLSIDSTNNAEAILRGNVTAKEFLYKGKKLTLGGAVETVTTEGSQRYDGLVEFNFDGLNLIVTTPSNSGSDPKITFTDSLQTWLSSATPLSLKIGSETYPTDANFNTISNIQNLTIFGNGTFDGLISIEGDTLIEKDATFSDSVTIKGKLNIEGNGTFETTSSVSNTGDITISRDAQLLGTINQAKSLNIIGTAQLASTISTTESQTYNGSVTLNGDTTLLSTGTGDTKKIIFKSTINSDNNATKRKLTIGSPSTSSTTTTNSVIFETTDATFTIGETAGLSSFILYEKATVSNNKPISITSEQILFANNSKLSTSNKQIDLIGNTFFGGESTLSAGTANIEAHGNIIINALDGNSAEVVNITSDFFTIHETTLSTGNFILLNGFVKLNTSITSQKDFILLNGNAEKMFNDDNSENSKNSGVKNLFSYHNSLRTSLNGLCPPSLQSIPTTMPDGTQIQGISATGKLPENSTDIQTGTFISSLEDFDGKIIKVGQNFYNNGVNLVPGAEWTLQLNENDSSTNSFAEMYNAAISDCKITCTIPNSYAWLSASENCSDYGNNTGLNSNGNTVNCTDKNSSIIYNQDGSYSRQLTGVAFLQPKILKNDDSKSASEGRAINPEIPNLSGTYSVRDNVIRIEFVKSNYSLGKEQKISSALIENSNNEISKVISQIKYNSLQGIPIEFEGAYIDAECTTSTDGKGDIASFYLKAKDDSRWNIDATGTTVGTKDSLGTQNNRTIDISIEKALENLFFTLTDEHKNRISSYSQIPSSQPNSEPGFLFTATTSRCIVGTINISLALTDFNSDKIYIYFDTPLSSTIDWNSLKNSFKFYSSLDTEYPGITVKDIDTNSLNKNGIILILNEKLSFDYIQYGFKIIYNDSYLFTNKIHCNSPRKVLTSGESHCISDFIVNTLDVQYAYDDKFEDIFENDNFNTLLLTIRDFSENAKNNKVFEEKNITLVTRPLVLDSNQPRFNYRLFADISPTANSNGDNFTKITGNSTRAWIPNNATNPILGFSSVLNNSPNLIDSTDPKISQETTTEGDVKFIFKNNPDESPFLDWKVGSNIQFMFEVLKNDNSPFQINHDFKVGGNTTGLYEFRLKNPNNLSSIDLWSFSVSSATKQRGGVSIFSNVINATNKEFCSIEVNTSKEGSLRVIVMTADGNVVKYLENGRKPQGQYYYFWNGTNNSGKSVARGIYFIRIVGSGIDETRKVMVVK